MANAQHEIAQPTLADQAAFSGKYEGNVPHIYRDHRGNLTVGKGFLLATVGDCSRYLWTPNLAAAQADWRDVSAAPFGQQYGAAWYRHLTSARVRDVDAAFARHVATFRQLIAEHWKLTAQPGAAQIALVDMAYTLGARGLQAYVNLHGAVMSRDWERAALESARGGVQGARNLATAALFRSLLPRSDTTSDSRHH